MLPTTTNIREAYLRGTDDEQMFIQNLSLYLCTYLKEHAPLIEKKPDLNENLMAVGQYLMNDHLTYYQTTNFRLFQTERVCRRQFQI